SNSRTAWTTTARVKEGTSASKRRSRQRPTRASLSEGGWAGSRPRSSGAWRAGHSPRAERGSRGRGGVFGDSRHPGGGGGGGGDAGSPVLAREVVAEDRLESEAVEESVEDRQGGDGVGVKGAAGGAGDPTGPERRGVLLAGAGGLARHEPSPRCDGTELD